jgi:hypothetical protein
VYSGEVTVQSTSHVIGSAHGKRMINIDDPVPLAREWFPQAVDRLKAAPDRPITITEAAHRLEREMDEAFRRHQVDARWGWGYIKNEMIALELWERKRPKKETVKNRRKR